MANAIQVQASPLAAPVPRGIQSFVVHAAMLAAAAAVGAALVVSALLVFVVASPVVALAIFWVLGRRRKLDRSRAWTLRPAGT